MRRLGRCTRGSVGTEFLVTFTPLCLFFFSIWQQALMSAGQELTQHAAIVAARSAAVVLPDDPSRYQGEAPNTFGPRRTDAVKVAAIHAMAPYVFDETIESVTITFPEGRGTLLAGQDLKVRVTSTFRCTVPLMQTLMCQTRGTTPLVAEATFPAQAARYTYPK